MSEFELSLKKREDTDISVTAQAMQGRQMQEVQGMVFMAKQFPRDQYQAWNKIKEACSRKSLAEVAQYEYPRGGQKVSGPSIRLAEVLAQNWGNMSAGVIELEQKYGESVAMAYAWDLETNFRVEKIFTVKHEMKAKGTIKRLEDPRDIYEMVANQGARRMRACILAVVPKDIVDAAEEKCEETLKKGNSEPLVDRVRKMFERFQNDHSVSKDMIEEYIGCKAEAFTEKDVLKLVRVYNSLKDGMAKREDYFGVKTAAKPDGAKKIEDELKNDAKEPGGK